VIKQRGDVAQSQTEQKVSLVHSALVDGILGFGIPLACITTLHALYLTTDFSWNAILTWRNLSVVLVKVVLYSPGSALFGIWFRGLRRDVRTVLDKMN